MRRPVCLIVNPSAGGGRTARLLPAVEASLRGHGIAFRVERTHSIEHARELGRATVAAGEVAAAMGGDGLISAVAGELRHTDGVLAVLPGGRGNDFARKLGLGGDPVAACDVLAAGREQRIDVADIDGRAFLGIASSGLDSDAGDLANATRLKLGQLVYVYATLRAVRAWRPARWEVVIDGAPRSFTGYSVAVANSGVFGGGMYLAPDAKLDDGLLDVVMIGTTCPSGPTWRRCRRSSPAPTSASRASRCARRARSPSTPTARSTCRPTATRSPTCPPPCGSSPVR